MTTLTARAILALGACSIVVGTAQAAEWHYNQPPSQPPAAATPMQQPDPETMTVPPVPGAGMNMPRGGMKLDKVRSEFGPPQQEIPAVGQPPILRWKYPDYIVYFEYDLVITSVPIDI
jgi:hypothetical protein